MEVISFVALAAGLIALLMTALLVACGGGGQVKGEGRFTRAALLADDCDGEHVGRSATS